MAAHVVGPPGQQGLPQSHRCPCRQSHPLATHTARIESAALAGALGLTFQQVQKYERGANRLSSSRLFDLARTVDVSLPYFFEEMSASVAAQAPSKLLSAKKVPEIEEDSVPMSHRETLELVRSYWIADAAVRKQLYNLVKTVVKAIQD